MKRISFKTKRLIIRPHRSSDHKEWLFGYTKSLSKKSKYDRSPLKESECTKKIFNKIRARHEKLARLDHTYVWAMYDKKTKRFVGNIDVFVICRDTLQIANLGYRIFNLYWRKGFAREALKTAMPKILISLKLNRLQAVIDNDNIPSIKLAKSVMKSEGTVKNYHYQDKDWADQKVFSVTRADLKLPVLHPQIYRP
jgi:RimJ/RimL family protein N-acetyltransferase